MRKALREVLPEVYEPKPEDEQRFKAKHGYDAAKHRWPLFKNMYSEKEYDALFSPKHPKVIDRAGDRHGYNPGDDEKHYEHVEQDGDTIDEMGTIGRRAQSVVRNKRDLSRGEPGASRREKLQAAGEWGNSHQKIKSNDPDERRAAAQENREAAMARRRAKGRT